MNDQTKIKTDLELVRKDIERQAELVGELIPHIRADTSRVASELNGIPSRVYLVGCGDSLNVGMATRFVWEKLLERSVEALPAMTFSQHAVDTAPTDALVVALSQSGSVSRVVEAVRVAHKRNLKILTITGKGNSPLALEPADCKYVYNYPKLGFVPGTTSYTIGLVIFYELAAAMCAKESEAKFLRNKVDNLPSLIKETVELSKQLAEQHASQIKKDTPLLVLGCGPHLGTAHFTARKFFEITQNKVFSQETEEYAHDAYSIIDSNFASILYAPPDRSFRRTEEIALYLKRLGLHLAVVTDHNKASEFVSLANLIYEIPETPIEMTPVTYAIPSQWLSYYCAKLFGGSFYAFADPVHYQDGDPQIYESEIVCG